MKRAMCRIPPVLAIALVMATISGVASAQSDVFTTSYFSNNTIQGAPTGTLRLSFDGPTSATISGRFLPFGVQDLCANIYVYAADQQ